MEVFAATENETEPHGRRPFHRSDCWYRTKPGAIEDNWTSYSTVAAALADDRRPCERCRPE
jgi:methylphosphotriester-DNA--protein-cysteine methyltransferase